MKERLTTAVIILVLLAAATLIVYVHISTTQAWLLDQKLREEGLATAVTILNLERQTSTRGPSYCEVTFAYTIDDMNYDKTTKVGTDFCAIFSVGSQAEALYIVGEPETADLTWGGYKETQFLIMLFCDGTAVLLVIVAVIAHYLNQKTSQQNSQRLEQQPNFPLTITPPRGSQLMEIGCLLPFGLLVTGLMGTLMGAALFNASEMDPGLPIVLFLSAIPFFAFGLLIIYLSLKDFVQTFTFTAEQIQVRYFLFKRNYYPATHLQDIAVEVRPLRSHRQSYALVLRFHDGSQIDVQRSSWSDADAPAHLIQLQTHLKQLYHLT